MGSKQSFLDFSGIFAKLKGERGIKIIVIIGLAGMALLLLSQLLGGGESKSGTASPVKTQDNSAYQQQAEKKLTEILSGIQGVGKLSVMVTLESSTEYVYAQEQKSSRDKSEEYKDGTTAKSGSTEEIENKYILVDGQSGNQDALVKTIIEPKIRGVLVVCDGADSAAVQRRILEAIAKVCGINSSKICVTR